VSPTVTFGNSRDNFEISPTRTGADAGKSATRTASLGLLKLDERETSLLACVCHDVADDARH
jgi:hypothetical protein